ncbi:hypothetical protein [uncultured Acidaminococcus sp.]|uniref:hypothetical protein n=1 Tax=uncultured Acidaminococcus sp. TaxID=352152 RepID=UPI002597D4AE|nr:hypothetical protein [uncultured Acidaminococcus sp.]
MFEFVWGRKQFLYIRRIKNIVKYVCMLLAVSFVFVSSLAFAAGNNKKTITLFYRVPDSVLACQNSEGDMKKGREEFEKDLVSNYKKRFIVNDIQPCPAEPEDAQWYTAHVKAGNTPFLVTINLLGSHMIPQTYQNAFGATIQGSAPAIDLSIAEDIVYPNNEFHGWGPVAIWWSRGSYAVGAHVYAYDNDRKNTKDAIKAAIRQSCTEKKINKYTNPTEYKVEQIRLHGDFYQFRAEGQQGPQVTGTK